MSGTQDLDEPLPLVEPWGKLLSLNNFKVKSQDLTLKEITIGRNDSNSFVIQDNRLSGNHCKLVFNDESNVATLTDLSTNGTFLGDSKIGKGNEIVIKNGDEIYLLHKTKVPQSEVIGFAFLLNKQKEAPSQINEQQEEKMKKMDKISEEINCPICDDVIFQAVTLMPCLHNFCGSCFSDWMAKQKTCPSCRKDVSTVSKNPMVNNLVEKYLEMHPEKKRSAEEYKAMDDNNKIKTDALNFNIPAPVVAVIATIQPTTTSSTRGRGRGRVQQVQVQPPPPQTGRLQRDVSDYSASSDDNFPSRECQTCKKEINGFSCKKRGQVHVNCRNCQAKMPRLAPNDQSLPHCCQICENSFCTLYYNGCEKLSKTNLNTRFKDGPVPNNVDIQIFRQNYIEQKFFTDHMRDKGISTRDIFQDMLNNFVSKNMFRYVINKRTHQNFTREIDIQITPETAVCAQCFVFVWYQMVFRYRIVRKDQMSAEIKNRGICWYGVNCKTMIHNQEHAKKMDHMCEQTKF